MASCLACESTNLGALPFRDGFLAHPLNQCAACGHIQVAVAPDPDRLRDYYVGIYSLQRAAFVDKGYGRIAERRARAQLDYFRDHMSDTAQLLDVGCGYGHLVSEAARRGITSAGLEYDLSAIQHGVNHHLNIRGVTSEQDIANEIAALRSGIVVMSHVLEHLRDPVRSLSACHHCWVFIEVPAYRADIVEQFVDQEGHLNFFNANSLLVLLRRLGFTIESHGTFGPGMRLFWQQRWIVPLRILRSLSRDYFLNRYGVRHADGIWVRVLARGSKCGF